jgi:hypothetical protein
VPQPSGRVMPGDPGFRRGQAELPRTPARRVPQSPQGSSQNIDPGALMPMSGPSVSVTVNGVEPNKIGGVVITSVIFCAASGAPFRGK